MSKMNLPNKLTIFRVILRTSVLQTLKEKCDAPECNPTVCRKARDAHEL